MHQDDDLWKKNRGIDRPALGFLLTSLPCILWYLKLIDYPSPLVAACHILQTAAPTNLSSMLPWQLITAMWKLYASSSGVVWWHGRGEITPFRERCLRTDGSQFSLARRRDCRKLVCLFIYHILFRNVTTWSFSPFEVNACGILPARLLFSRALLTPAFGFRDTNMVFLALLLLSVVFNKALERSDVAPYQGSHFFYTVVHILHMNHLRC